VKFKQVIWGTLYQRGGICRGIISSFLYYYYNKWLSSFNEFSFFRFLPEEKSKRDPLTYLPFGYGPRNCVGMRFADLEMRMAVAHLIKQFNFTPANDAPVK
jgi:hypothetical protein